MPAMTPAGLVQRWDAYRTKWNTLFQSNLESLPSYWEQFATLVPSTTKKEEYIWLDRLPQMREWVDERLFNNPSVRLQEIENKLFELSINLKRTDLEDDTLGVFDRIVPMIAERARAWPDIQMAAALKNGSSVAGYDGQSFFDGSHPVDMDNTAKVIPGTAYNTQPNLFTGAASGNQPGAMLLTGPNLITAYSVMSSWVGPDLQPLNVIPNLLIVPPQLKFTAKAILDSGSELIGKDIALSGGSHGAAAPSNELRGTLDYLVLPYLSSDPTSWYLLCTTRATKPFVWQLRESPEQVFFTKPTDTDVFLHDEFKWGVRARGAPGYAQWSLAAKAMAT
jgi:phage major head subunit gpT-like protein